MKSIITSLAIMLFVSVALANRNNNPLTCANLKVNTISQNQKNVYLGTDHGIIIINKKSNKRTYLTQSNSQLPDNHVTSIACGENDNVFFGTEKGILRFDGFAYMTITTENANLTDNHITSLAIDKENNLWIGTYFGGLIKKSGNHYQLFQNENSQLSKQSVFSISVDNAGDVWVGFYNNGLVKIHNDVVTGYSIDASVQYVKQIAAGTFSIGTYNNGEFLFDGKTFEPNANTSLNNKKIIGSYFSQEFNCNIVCCEDGIVKLQNDAALTTVNICEFVSNVASVLASK